MAVVKTPKKQGPYAGIPKAKTKTVELPSMDGSVLDGLRLPMAVRMPATCDSCPRRKRIILPPL